MGRVSAFAPVAAGAIARMRDIALDVVDADLPDVARGRLREEVTFHAETLEEAFEYRKAFGPPLGPADSDAYFSEKLIGMLSFVNLAISPEDRASYSGSQIIDNIDHYSYIVAQLVAAPWRSRARRPATDRVLKRTSSEHRDVLQRLADR